MTQKSGKNKLANSDTGTLSGQLWEAANILRGPVDAADFKTYIFPLLFFKRLSEQPLASWIAGLPKADQTDATNYHKASARDSFL
jgi:type I restriction enzyme M protein